MLHACSDVDSFAALEHVGVAIKSFSPRQKHVGLIYRVDNDLNLLHLAWHIDLRNEPVKPGYFWGVCGLFVDDALNGKIFAARMLSVARNQGIIPYGVYANGKAFAENGSFVPFPEPGMGLTCATFVIQLFHSFGHAICDLSSWEARDDDATWQAEIIEKLREDYPQHADRVSDYIGRHRIRPEEAAAAVMNPAPPTSFSRAVELAAEINEMIRAAKPEN
jgi:hypothetical protein